MLISLLKSLCLVPRTGPVQLLLVALAPGLAWGEKTDIFILTNGDRVTGEIKKLEAGILHYLSLIHITEPTRRTNPSRMPYSA